MPEVPKAHTSRQMTHWHLGCKMRVWTSGRRLYTAVAQDGKMDNVVQRIWSCLWEHQSKHPPPFHTPSFTSPQIRIALAFTAALLLAAVLLQAAGGGARQTDFASLYTAALIVRQGHFASLYDLQTQAATQAGLQNGRGLLPFYPPPFEALFLAPLALLSYGGAYVVWGLLNIFLWVSFACLVRPYAPVPRQAFRYLVICFSLLAPWVALLDGQTSLLLLVLYTLAFIGLKRGREFAAGAVLGLGLFKFQLVLPFALIYLLRRKWRFLGGFAVVGLALCGLSILAIGPAGVTSYLTLLLNSMRHPVSRSYIPAEPSDMPSLWGLLSTVAPEGDTSVWADYAVALVSVPLILFAAWAGRRQDRQRGNGLGMDFAVALVVTILTGFHVYSYDLCLMLLAVLLVIGSAQWSQKSAWRVALNASILTLYLPPVWLLVGYRGKLCLLGLPVMGFAAAAFGLLRQPPGREQTEPVFEERPRGEQTVRR